MGTSLKNVQATTDQQEWNQVRRGHCALTLWSTCVCITCFLLILAVNFYISVLILKDRADIRRPWDFSARPEKFISDAAQRPSITDRTPSAPFHSAVYNDCASDLRAYSPLPHLTATARSCALRLQPSHSFQHGHNRKEVGRTILKATFRERPSVPTHSQSPIMNQNYKASSGVK